MRPSGVRLIVAYKLVKATAQLTAAGVIAAVVVTGRAGRVEAIVEEWRHHFAGAWSTHLSELLLRATTPRTLYAAAAALALDGVLSGVEGWALRRGRPWGRWLVVAATSALLPFEVVSLVRHPHVSRVVAIVVNVAIVAYLAREARRTLDEAGPDPSDRAQAGGGSR